MPYRTIRILVLLSTCLCTSCATSVGMAAAAVTSASLAVGGVVVTAPFKVIGLMNGDDDEDENEDDAEAPDN